MPLPPLWIAIALAFSPVRATAPLATRPDTIIDGASAALARGRPWQASRLIASVLADSTRRTPDAVMLAATAASRWGGWPEVTRLLDGQPWVDTGFGGQGRMLLARAALEQGRHSAALRHALMLQPSADDAVEGERLVLLARALDRLDARDSAAATYTRAAERLPGIGDWLRVRAAAATGDSMRRVRLYEGIIDPLARERIPYSEAAAHQRTGDLVGAARGYAALGARAAALRLRWESSPDSARRADVRRDLVSLIAARRSPGEVRDAIVLLDEAYAPLAPAEELEVARAAATAGAHLRAVTGFAAAFGAGLGKLDDRMAYGTALTRLGRHREAAGQFARVVAPHPLAGPAAYQRARALVRDGDVATGRIALRTVPVRFPRDTSAASSALFLLGDLATDDRADSAARLYYRRVADHYPTSQFAPSARFRAAMIALVGGHADSAAAEFDQLAQRYARSDEAGAATYWAGRAHAAAGDSVAARTRWERQAAGDPASYYTGLASARLGLAPWAPPAAPDTFAVMPAIEIAVARAELLIRLGLTAESRWEYDRLLRRSDASSEELLALADAFRRQDHAWQSIQLARRALALGAPADARTYRLLYPVVLEEALQAEAEEHGLEASFMAAIIRQESMFNPGATSPVGARGLMQVMPELGGRLAQALGYPVWDPVLLYQPDVSLQLGAHHLQELAGKYQQPVHMLAAYNAGGSRVDRWSQRVGVEDPEVFTDRIPFVETRGYVRAISRNQAIYRALYAWTPIVADAPSSQAATRPASESP